MKRLLSLCALMIISVSGFAHVFEIRYQQDPIDGSIYWYLQSYHPVNQVGCAAADAGLTITANSVSTNYPISAVLPGDIRTLFPTSTLLGVQFICNGTQSYPASYVSYAVVHTPYSSGTVSVTPYSSSVCFDFCVGGSTSFTPPALLPCVTCPIQGFSNTTGTPNDKGTACDQSDDYLPVTLTVNHNACASNTGDGMFTVQFGSTTIGTYPYNVGPTPNTVTFNVPVGTSNSSQVTVSDPDFSANCGVTHGLTIPGGIFTGATETTPPVLTCPANQTVNNDPGICGAVVTYNPPTVTDNCSTCPQGSAISGFNYLGNYNGHDYYKSSFSTSWTSANGVAAAVGGHLAAIGNAGENAFLASPSVGIAWIGFTDAGTEGTFLWTNGESPTAYTNWDQLCAAEPNNLGNEDYTVINWCLPGKWNDLPNTSSYPFIVEFDCIAPVLTSGPATASGQTFPLGTTTVSYSATDAAGNPATCSFTVTVVDNEGPVMTCPAATVVSCVGDVPAPDPGSVTATDNCSVPTVTWEADVITNQTCPNRYTITRTYKATDAKSNSSTCTQIITVDDQTAPVISSSPANTMVSCAGQVPAPDDNAVMATDNCGGAVTVTHSADVISNQTCANRYTISRTYTATDACGNAKSATQTIIVNDQTAPVISSSPANTMVSCTGDVPAPNDNAVTATDNCGGTVTITHGANVITDQTCANRYTISRTYTATDACGNASSVTQTIIVNDQTPPVARCKNITVDLSGGTFTITPAMVDNGSSDNCGSVTLTLSKSTFVCADAGLNTVTLTATDACGMTSTCTATVTVQYQPTCTITVTPSNSTPTGGIVTNLYLGYGPPSATITVNATGGSGFTYSWAGPTGYLGAGTSSRLFTPTVEGTYTFTVTVTNSNGCSTTCSVTFCVRDIRSAGNGNGNGNNDKVNICHIPPGNPANFNTLSVSTNAVATHLAHGDYLGACGQTCGSPVARMIQASNSGNVIGEEVKVYPNPNNGSFTVEIPYVEAGNSYIMVTDAQGKTVARRQVAKGEGQKLNISLGDVARGVYFIEVIYGDQIFRSKLSVQ